MGDIADGLIDGTFDEITGEYLGEGPGYPRTRVQGQYNTIKPKKKHKPRLTSPAERKIDSIKKEIAAMHTGGMPLDEARRLTNIKYGKGWRERGLTTHANNQWTDEELKDFQVDTYK